MDPQINFTRKTKIYENLGNKQRKVNVNHSVAEKETLQKYYDKWEENDSMKTGRTSAKKAEFIRCSNENLKHQQNYKRKQKTKQNNVMVNQNQQTRITSELRDLNLNTSKETAYKLLQEIFIKSRTMDRLKNKHIFSVIWLMKKSKGKQEAKLNEKIEMIIFGHFQLKEISLTLEKQDHNFFEERTFIRFDLRRSKASWKRECLR